MTDFNLSHALMLAKLRVEPGLQRLSIHVSALGQRYERFGHFAMIAVGYANHQRFADGWMVRSEEHTSELQSLMRISYAVFCLQKKTQLNTQHITRQLYAH